MSNTEPSSIKETGGVQKELDGGIQNPKEVFSSILGANKGNADTSVGLVDV